jgi:hypothetical protein
MAIALGWMAEGQMPFNHALLLCSVSLATAFMASLLQGKAQACPLPAYFGNIILIMNIVVAISL